MAIPKVNYNQYRKSSLPTTVREAIWNQKTTRISINTVLRREKLIEEATKVASFFIA